MTPAQIRSEACSEQIQMFAPFLRALASVALEWDWDEETFVCLTRVMWRRERDGQFPERLNGSAGKEQP